MPPLGRDNWRSRQDLAGRQSIEERRRRPCVGQAEDENRKDESVVRESRWFSLEDLRILEDRRSSGRTVGVFRVIRFIDRVGSVKCFLQASAADPSVSAHLSEDCLVRGNRYSAYCLLYFSQPACL